MKVFVYGSLKRGRGNHRIIEDEVLLQEDSVQGFKMVSLGGFPAVFREEGSSITGELYEVSDETMPRLDMLEGHPTFYHREPVTLDSGVEAILYEITNPNHYKDSPTVEGGTW